MNGKEITWGATKVSGVGEKQRSLAVVIPNLLVKAKRIRKGDVLVFKTLPDGAIRLEQHRQEDNP